MSCRLIPSRGCFREPSLQRVLGGKHLSPGWVDEGTARALGGPGSELHGWKHCQVTQGGAREDSLPTVGGLRPDTRTLPWCPQTSGTPSAHAGGAQGVGERWANSGMTGNGWGWLGLEERVETSFAKTMPAVLDARERVSWIS